MGRGKKRGGFIERRRQIKRRHEEIRLGEKVRVNA